MIFQCWATPDGSEMTFAPVGGGDIENDELWPEPPELLYQIQAPTWEDAMRQHHDKQGWEPYQSS